MCVMRVSPCILLHCSLQPCHNTLHLHPIVRSPGKGDPAFSSPSAPHHLAYCPCPMPTHTEAGRQCAVHMVSAQTDGSMWPVIIARMCLPDIMQPTLHTTAHSLSLPSQHINKLTKGVITRPTALNEVTHPTNSTRTRAQKVSTTKLAMKIIKHHST